MKLVIFVEGGSIKQILADQEVEVRIIDTDVEGVDREDILMVDGEESYIYRGHRKPLVNEERTHKLFEEIKSGEAEVMLETLHELTKIEQKRELTLDETHKYIEIVDECKENNIEIPFAVEV